MPGKGHSLPGESEKSLGNAPDENFHAAARKVHASHASSEESISGEHYSYAFGIESQVSWRMTWRVKRPELDPSNLQDFVVCYMSVHARNPPEFKAHHHG